VRLTQLIDSVNKPPKDAPSPAGPSQAAPEDGHVIDAGDPE
jgi:hypothetical protein